MSSINRFDLDSSRKDCQREMDCTLDKLVKHFCYNFNAVAASFQKYLRFLKTIYPRELNDIDASLFTAGVCRARYAALDYKKWSIPLSASANKSAKGLQRLTIPISPTPTPINTPAGKQSEGFSEKLEISIQTPQVSKSEVDKSSIITEDTPRKESQKLQDLTRQVEIQESVPSTFSIFDDKRVKIHEIYDQVRNSLPSASEGLSDDEKEAEIFKFDIPPESDFEKKLFSEIDFWKMHEELPNNTTYSYVKESMNNNEMYNFDDSDQFDQFEDTLYSPSRKAHKTQQILSSVQPISPSRKNSSHSNIHSRLKEMKIEGALIELGQRSNSEKAPPSTTNWKSPERGSSNRSMRMRVIEYSDDEI